MDNTKPKTIREAVAGLLNVKSLVTLALTIGFIIQSVQGTMNSDYSSVYLVVISFYFGTQYQKGVQNAST